MSERGVPVSVGEMADLFENELCMRSLVDSIYDGRMGMLTTIFAGDCFRAVMYCACTGTDSINKIDKFCRNNDTLSLLGVPHISARTIGRSYRGMQVADLKRILQQEGRRIVKRTCTPHACKGRIILDMTTQFGIMAVVVRYFCPDHGILVTADFEELRETEQVVEARNLLEGKARGEGESKAWRRVVPRVRRNLAEYIGVVTGDGYYSYWAAAIMRKYFLFYAFKLSKESLNIVQSADDKIKYLYEAGLPCERLTPREWCDGYKHYKAWDADFVRYHSDAEKSPYKGRKYRITLYEESYKSQSKQRETERLRIMTNIPSWLLDSREIRGIGRDEWKIESTFWCISQIFNSKSKGVFFQKDRNSKLCLFMTVLVAENLYGHYMHTKAEEHEWLSKDKKAFNVPQIMEHLKKSWPRRRRRSRKNPIDLTKHVSYLMPPLWQEGKSEKVLFLAGVSP